MPNLEQTGQSKSRALMFVALDKLINQGIKKVIVAVPQKSIGSSFSNTNLKEFGFYADWEVEEKYNLCIADEKKALTKEFNEFLTSKAEILICTHSTLRNTYEYLDKSKFDNVLLAIDEFHHVSSSNDNKLGELLRFLMSNTTAHIVAMTGSYFRGDNQYVLLPEDEVKFTKVTYNYYDQLNGYEYLKSLGIGYHFYTEKYTSAIGKVLDTDKKTIKDKHGEVDRIIDIIGTVEKVTDDIDKNRAEADFVAKRTKCDNFEKYESLFKECQKDLKDRKRKLIDSIENKLEVGTFCVLDGVLLYIAHIEKAQRGNSNKLNRRTTLIFENATQSNMLHRSLGKRLKDNGKMVTKLDEEVLKNLDQTNDKNKPNGYIYILESLSNDDKITTKKDLYKIGFSTTSVEQRIKNAKNDPTYLMADVKIIQTYKVYDSNPHKLEKLIHKFFSHCCLNVDIVDAKGNLYNPKEWFIVPLNIIEEAIELIKNRRIINYKYDYEIEKIIKK